MADFDQQALIDFLLQGAQTPYPSQLPSDSLDDWGGDLNMLNRAASRFADPAYLIMNGFVDPGAFDPITTYEPVQVPGRQLLDQYFVGGNPLQKRIAELIDAGRLGSQILIELQSDPELAQYAPRQMVEDASTGAYTPSDVPDWRAVQGEIESLTSTLASDPVFDQEYFERTGQYMSATTEDSPMREKLFDIGITSTPGETYDPYLFAPEGQDARDVESFDREERTRETADSSVEQFNEQLAAMRRAMNAPEPLMQPNPGGTQFINAATNGNAVPLQTPNRIGRGRHDGRPGPWTGATPGNAAPFPLGGTGGVPADLGRSRHDGRPGPWTGAGASASGPLGGTGGASANLGARGGSGRPPGVGIWGVTPPIESFQDRYGKQKASTEAWAQAEINRRAQAQREAIVQELSQAGVTPFDDEIRRRNMMMYGG